MTNTCKAKLLRIVAATVNPVTLKLARSGNGPFSLVRHVRRRFGRTYETPLILATAPDGFVAELTFGPTASWYRNIEALSASTETAPYQEPFMARIATVKPQNASTTTRLAYFFTARLFRRLTGRRTTESMLGPLQLYAHLPRLLRAYGRLEQATSQLHGLSDRHRALAELKAAARTNCEYCIDLGSQIARQWGLNDAELLALPTYATSDLFTPIDKLVLDYASGMSSTPVEVDDHLVQLLSEHFTPTQLVELTHVIALENHRGRFNLALGVPAAGFSQQQVCAIPEGHASEPYHRTADAAAAAVPRASRTSRGE